MSRLTVHPVMGFGAEDVVVGGPGRHEGAVFTGTEDGSILRMSHDGRTVERVAVTGGRPLGIEIEPDGRLVVADANRGVIRVDVETGGIEPLADSAGGTRCRFVDNSAVAADGTVWFSDSSTRYELPDWKKDFLEGTRTGRLLRLDPDGTVGVELDGLAFANGVALSAAEDYVAVAETGARTVVRRWLTGERAGTRDFLVSDLPGYPDNIARGSDGLIWVTIASPRDPVVERVMRSPLAVRWLAGRLPEAVQPAVRRSVRVQAYDDTGLLVHDLDLDASRFHAVTGVREHDGRVWLSSLFEAAVAVVDL